MTGENIDTLIYKTSLKESGSEFHIVDVSWYKDVLYIVGNNTALYRYNISSHQKTKLNIHSVGSVAVDWISKKLYWANPKQQIVMNITSITNVLNLSVTCPGNLRCAERLGSHFADNKSESERV